MLAVQTRMAESENPDGKTSVASPHPATAHAADKPAPRAPANAADDDEEPFTDGPGPIPALGLMMAGALSESLVRILVIAFAFF